MNATQKADALMMFSTGRFSIKEIAAHLGVYEFEVGKWIARNSRRTG